MCRKMHKVGIVIFICWPLDSHPKANCNDNAPTEWIYPISFSNGHLSCTAQSGLPQMQYKCNMLPWLVVVLWFMIHGWSMNATGRSEQTTPTLKIIWCTLLHLCSCHDGALLPLPFKQLARTFYTSRCKQSFQANFSTSPNDCCDIWERIHPKNSQSHVKTSALEPHVFGALRWWVSQLLAMSLMFQERHMASGCGRSCHWSKV